MFKKHDSPKAPAAKKSNSSHHATKHSTTQKKKLKNYVRVTADEDKTKHTHSRSATTNFKNSTSEFLPLICQIKKRSGNDLQIDF